MSTPQEIQEATEVGIFAEASVEGGAVEGASLLGRISKNGRIYSDDSMDEAADLYPGTAVYLDHPKSKSTATRSIRDLAGRVVQAYRAGDRVKGTIETLDTEPGRLVRQIAERMPDVAGASHRAAGKVATDDKGRELVTSISEVRSVDIVTAPATVDGLRESIEAESAERDPLGKMHRHLNGPGALDPAVLRQMERTRRGDDGAALDEILRREL